MAGSRPNHAALLHRGCREEGRCATPAPAASSCWHCGGVHAAPEQRVRTPGECYVHHYRFDYSQSATSGLHPIRIRSPVQRLAHHAREHPRRLPVDPCHRSGRSTRTQRQRSGRSRPPGSASLQAAADVFPDFISTWPTARARCCLGCLPAALSALWPGSHPSLRRTGGKKGRKIWRITLALYIAMTLTQRANGPTVNKETLTRDLVGE